MKVLTRFICDRQIRFATATHENASYDNGVVFNRKVHTALNRFNRTGRYPVSSDGNKLGLSLIC